MSLVVVFNKDCSQFIYQPTVFQSHGLLPQCPEDKKVSEVALQKLQEIQYQMIGQDQGSLSIKSLEDLKRRGPWYEAIRSLVLEKTFMAARSPKFRLNADKKISEFTEGLIRSKMHTERFIRQMIKNELGMPAVALIASYLKDKRYLDTLYVCKSLEALSQKLTEIKNSSKDGKYAFVVAEDCEEEVDASEDSQEYVSAVDHKIAICVQKQGPKINVVILDPLGMKKSDIKSCPLYCLFSSAAELEIAKNKHNDVLEEIVLWYLVQALGTEGVQFYFSSLARQKTFYGCETFALKDAITFLRTPHFFKEITVSPVTVEHTGPDKKKRSFKFFNITALPPKFMKSTQSMKLLNSYLQNHLKDSTQKQANLMMNLQKHINIDFEEMRNSYIDRQSLKYHLFVLSALVLLNQETIEKLTEGTLLRAYRSQFDVSVIQTPSDLHLHRSLKSKL